MDNTYIYSYVSSEGVNPATGEHFPDGEPKYRSTHEIFELLQLGFKVEQRMGDLSIPLNAASFAHKYINEMTANLEKAEKLITNNEKHKRK